MLKKDLFKVKDTFFCEKVLNISKYYVCLQMASNIFAIRNRLLLTLKTRIYATKEDI